VDAGERTAFIRLAAEVSEQTALAILETQTIIETRVEWKGLVPRTIISRRAQRLFLGEERRASSFQEASGDFPRLLREKGLSVLPWMEQKAHAHRLLARIRFFADRENAMGLTRSETGNSDWSEQTLVRDAQQWLVPFLQENRGGAPILTVPSLENALKSRLGWDRIAVFDREVPENLIMPNGRSRVIQYDSGEPVVSARLQDCFGITVHPKIMGAPVIFHLLSPADRPVQITADLPGFWAGSYADVRKDMKGRYPKHFWPEIGSL
jgi:ATP-dependent helicase HrpB